MAINTLATATLFQKTLDQLAVQEAVTGWMEANASQVQYNGGAEVKIPKMTVQGLADYDRDNGYVQGAVTMEYETFKMTQDRGRKFQLDAMAVDEANFIPTASTVMGEFQRTFVVPEIDAYRISALATKAITAKQASEFKPEIGKTTGVPAFVEFKTALKEVRKHYQGPLVAHVSSDFLLALQLELADKIHTVTFAVGGINTQVPSIDGVPLIETASDRMYSAITMNDGTTDGQEVGGYKKATDAKDVNFLIASRIAPLAVSKQDKMRIFTPDNYQKANAWAMDYRRFHDIWVRDNTVNQLFVSTVAAA